MNKVINAFRHQRFLHTNLKEVDAVGLISDQRLSASKIFALVAGSPYTGLPLVINAFRHQRFLHSAPKR